MINKKQLLLMLGIFIIESLCLSGCQKKSEKKEAVEAVKAIKAVESNKVIDNQKYHQKDEGEVGTTREEDKATKRNEVSMSLTEKPEEILDDDEKIAEFFNDVVLTGDSISKHFGNFITKHRDALPGEMMLLSEGSFSLHNAKEEPTADSTFPLYQGEKMKIEDAISLMGVHNVFMFYGINDLGRDTPEKCLKLYDEQIDRLVQKSPDIKVFIISPTYLHKDKANVYKNLNNKNIKKFNELLIKYCNTTQKATYVDLVTKLQDDKGNLKAEYCSDSYCHHSEKAFAIWIDVLMEQAKREVIKE